MTNCAKCGRLLTSSNVDRANHGVVQWCVFCPRATEHLWDREVVGSKTNYVGGRVGKTGGEDDPTMDYDPRDGDVGESWH